MADKQDQSPSKDIIFRAMWNNMLPMIREQGGDIFGKIAETAVRPIAADEKMAKKVGELVDNTFQVGLSVSVNVRDFTVVAKESRKRIGAMLDDVEPYLVEEFGKSSRGKLMRSKNEVIAHERDRLMGQTKFGYYRAASGLTDKLPELYNVVDKKRAAMARGEAAVAADGNAIDDMKHKLDEGLGKVASSGLFDEGNRKLVDAAIRTGAPAMMEYIEAEGRERFGKLSAYGMIKELAEQARSGDGTVRYAMHPQTGEQMPLDEYIMEVFRQHQEDVGGVPLNDRFRFLPELREACQQIAEEIDGNLLDPMALVSLVGNRKVLDEKLRVANPEKVSEEIRGIWRVIEKSQHVDVQEFISETAFATKDDFKAILDNLPAEEKPFFASLFPEEVLKQMGGLKEQEIDALKEQGAKDFSAQMTAAIESLGTLTEKELQRVGLTEKEGRLMRELSQAIDELGASEVVGSLQGQARQDVAEAVRNARGYWQERVSGGGRNREAEAEEVAENDVSFAERVNHRKDDPSSERSR